MNHGPIHVQIDELVLHGFNPADRHAIADAVERELRALLADRGLPAPWRTGSDRIDAGTVHPGPRTNPALVGAQIARAVHGGTMR